MTIKNFHPKIQELKLRAAPVSYSNSYVNTEGQILAAEEENTIKGYLCVWGQRDTYGTKFVKGCFTKSIRERGPESNSKYKITFLWQHDSRDPIGRFTVLREDDLGLYFEAVVDNIEEVPNGMRALKQVKSGTLNQFSVGFDYIWDKIEYDEADDSIVLLEVELYEGSIVTRGSVPGTYAFRSAEEFTTEKEALDDATESVIKSLPRSKQLEVREIISRHVTLAASKPQELAQQETRSAALAFVFEPVHEESGSINMSEILKTI